MSLLGAMGSLLTLILSVVLISLSLHPVNLRKNPTHAGKDCSKFQVDSSAEARWAKRVSSERQKNLEECRLKVRKVPDPFLWFKGEGSNSLILD